MLNVDPQTVSSLANAGLINRLARMLVDVGTVRPEADLDSLRSLVAVLLDEAWEQGIRTERLLGMHVLIRISDQMNPFDDARMSAVLRDPTLAEDDKAHLLQMIRLNDIQPGQRA